MERPEKWQKFSCASHSMSKGTIEIRQQIDKSSSRLLAKEAAFSIFLGVIGNLSHET